MVQIKAQERISKKAQYGVKKVNELDAIENI